MTAGAVAYADSPQNPNTPVVTWIASGDTKALQLAGQPETEVSVRFRATLAELEHSWTQGPYVTDALGVLTVAVEVPPEAWLHEEASGDYVTDLTVTVAAGQFKVRAPESYLAWPSGRGTAARVWDAQQQRSLAAHGVLRAELREGVTDPELRLMPDVSDSGVSEPRQSLTDTGRPE